MIQPLTDEDLHECCQDRVAAMNAELMEKSPQEILQWAVSGPNKQWTRPLTAVGWVIYRGLYVPAI